jgi:hypothetical protein
MKIDEISVVFRSPNPILTEGSTRISFPVDNRFINDRPLKIILGRFGMSSGKDMKVGRAVDSIKDGKE